MRLYTSRSDGTAPSRNGTIRDPFARLADTTIGAAVALGALAGTHGAS